MPDVDLRTGWLEDQMRDIRACVRANKKIVAAELNARVNGSTQPTKIEFSIPELRALAYMVRCSGLAD